MSSAGRLAIKITIASLITVGLSLYFGITPANTSIALLTIIYTVGETFGSSLETGLNRAAGSVIGYGFGAIMVLIALPMWIAAPVAVGLTLFVCALLPMRLGIGWQPSWRDPSSSCMATTSGRPSCNSYLQRSQESSSLWRWTTSSCHHIRARMFEVYLQMRSMPAIDPSPPPSTSSKLVPGKPSMSIPKF